MDDAYSFQSTLMGDVLFRDVTELSITADISDTIIHWEEHVDAGTWFASPLHLIQYMLNGFNTQEDTWLGGTSWSATVDGDPESDNYGKIVVTNARYAVTLQVAFVVGDATVAADCGLPATVWYHQNVDSSTFAFPDVIPVFLTPRWPVHTYMRGVRATGGYSRMAHDGTVYSFSGYRRETVDLGVTLDRRDGDYTEVTAWRNIWNKRWAVGRAVTFYLNREDIPTTYTVVDGEASAADVLVLDEAPGRQSGKQVIEHKHFADQQEVYTFVQRPGVRQDRGYNLAGSPEA